jgi:hypothetical protein
MHGSVGTYCVFDPACTHVCECVVCQSLLCKQAVLRLFLTVLGSRYLPGFSVWVVAGAYLQFSGHRSSWLKGLHVCLTLGVHFLWVFSFWGVLVIGETTQAYPGCLDSPQPWFALALMVMACWGYYAPFQPDLHL